VGPFKIRARGVLKLQIWKTSVGRNEIRFDPVGYKRMDVLSSAWDQSFPFLITKPWRRMGSGGIVHHSLSSALAVGEWPGSRPRHFTHGPRWIISISIATGWTTGVRFPAEAIDFFLYSTSSRPALELTQPPIQCVPSALSPGVKRPWREANYSPYISEVKIC
jgi:hypothetical protein